MPSAPRWPDRDRFVLSAGHGSMLLYALLYLAGYADMTIDEIKRFRQLGSKPPGHPEYGHALGIETTTGPLGQGLATSVGMAIAERALAARYGADLVDHRTYVIAGDGCLMEGVSHEAIDLAGHLKLYKLTCCGTTTTSPSTARPRSRPRIDQRARFAAAGWHDDRRRRPRPCGDRGGADEGQGSDRPTMIACRTTIGFGAPNKAGTESAHGAPLGAAEVEAAREEARLDLSPPFEIPADILAAWRAAGARSRARALAWEARLAARDRARAPSRPRSPATCRPSSPSAMADYKARPGRQGAQRRHAARPPRWRSR